MSLLASIPLTVRITDVNYGNHLGNDALVGLIHEARVQWLHGLSLSELDIGGTGIIMKDLAVQFKAECFWGDQLEVDISVIELSTVAFKLRYQLFKKSVETPEQRKLAADATTTLVSFRYDIRKVAAIPESLHQMLQTHLNPDSRSSS